MPLKKAIKKTGMNHSRKHKKQNIISKENVEEPLVSYTTRMRAIGNSKGLILNNQVLAAAEMSPDADIIVKAGKGVIYITEFTSNTVNTDLSSWDKQFKSAIKRGAESENDMFSKMENKFDKNEW
jgi:hypothetical protein